jgi:phosphatidylcholine synthase
MSNPSPEQSQIKNQKPQILFAWLVHAFTALGLVFAAGMAVLIFRGDAASFRWTFVLMLAATIIDAVDGTFARWARVKEVLPGFDGRRLDDIIDFQTYTSLPLLLIWRAGILPDGWAWWLVVPLVASAYGFCQTAAKTDDGFFLGFPSYWNLVAFYLYVLRPAPWGSLALVLVLAVLTFVPTRYLYLSQSGRLNRLTMLLAAVWIVLPVWILFQLGDEAASSTALVTESVRGLAILSLFFPVYYFIASWFISVRMWIHRGRSGGRREGPR